MTILSDRWKGLLKVPHVPLTALPTAVEQVPALSRWAGAEIWIKRDDRTSPRYGGNKVRKLEYLLGEALARESDTLITAGAAGSHHVLATALFGAEQGFDVHALLVPQRFSAHVEQQLRAVLAAGAEIHPLSTSAAAIAAIPVLAAKLRMRGRRPYVIAPGGSSVAGTLGHVEAGLELARQMEAGVLPEPDAIVVALGSGGTAAGLAVGLAAAGITSRIIAVRVVPRLVGNGPTLTSLVRRTVARLRSLDERFPDVSNVAREHLVIDHREIGGGYGEPTSGGENAARLAYELAGIELEPTYTAKAFAAVLRHAREALAGRRILYVHTLSGADLGPSVQGAPPLPRALARLLRR